MNAFVNPIPQRFYATRPDAILHLEGLFFLIVACVAYGHFYPGRWGLFALLFLVPDVALVPYLWSRGRAAAASYNLVHTYVLPLALGLVAWISNTAILGQLALIWSAHISFDRLMGYGLKYPDEFRRTHIQNSASI